VLHLVSEPTLAVTRACVDQVHRHMARRGTWAGTGCMDVSKRGSSWTRVDRRGCWSSKGVRVCDILAQGLIGLIGYLYQQGIPFFPEAYLKRTPG
jgi:hypothetical protein